MFLWIALAVWICILAIIYFLIRGSARVSGTSDEDWDGVISTLSISTQSVGLDRTPHSQSEGLHGLCTSCDKPIKRMVLCGECKRPYFMIHGKDLAAVAKELGQ